jgi:alkaline phosphatase D
MRGNAFLHGVASGDPTPSGVVIWTRVTTEDDDVAVTWRVATDAELGDVVASGEARASAARDHCVHVDLDGLEPGTTYFYGFEAGGESSPVARTRTLAAEPQRLRFAQVSCAKFNAGHFNAYGRIAERDDLDFLLHLGDYIYEASQTPPPSQTPSPDMGRPFDPPGECRTLADYRTRYAQYHLDPDVQALHHALPMIATLDDHELADGAWRDGAQEHREDEHGPWADRKAAAFQARWEWLPARPPDPADTTRVFRAIRAGGLADILLLDIRSRRDEPALDPVMSEPGRSMLGDEQREWLLGELDASTAAWRLVGSPSIVHRTWVDDAGEPLTTALLKLKLCDEDAEGPDEDQWDGYPAERALLLERFAALDDVVVLSSDIHVCVASELRGDDGTPASVEFTTPSLTSQNLDEKLKVEPRADVIADSERAFVAALDHVHWCDFSGHGYAVIDVDADRVRAEWWLVDTIMERSGGERQAAAFEVARGHKTLSPG